MLRLIFLSLLSFSVCASASEYPSLWKSADPILQDKLEKLIIQRGLMQQVVNGNLALAIVDITNPYQPHQASLNGDKMIYAASLPKIAILLGAFVQIEAGVLEANEALLSELILMIRYSDNNAATRVLDLVGRDKLLEILQSLRFKLYTREHDGGLWVGKDYAREGAYQRDPLHNLSHGASVMQVARFYYLLDTNRLVNPELTEQMKEILSKPAISHKFVKGLQDVPDAVLFRKSGTWKDYHADSALVEFGSSRYILVGLVKNKQGGRWLTELALPLHKLIVDTP
jgi:beta-lactamase class A